MNGSDPADYQDTPRLITGWQRSHFDPWLLVSGASCEVIPMSPLARELVLEIVAAPIDYDETGRIGHIAALILDEMRTLDA